MLMDFVWRWSETLPLRTTNCFKWRYISNGFVLRELKQLKRQKAHGVDKLPSGMLKDCRVHIYQPLGHIINLSLQYSKVPSMWKIAKVIPIHKKGAHNNPENYRPISVLPVLSKVLERALHQQLSEFLKEQNLLTKYQFGYRSNRSTNLAATLFLDDIRREVDVGNMVGAVFIDLSKAFDTLGHSILLGKLPAYGVHDNELLWFTDYLFGRQQYVQLGKGTSSMQSIYSGVPQGSILGPLLFNLYFSDFADHLLKTNVLMYADDTVIYRAGKDIETIENVLTEELEQVARYFDENQLVINLKKDKTEVMLFGTAKRRSLQNRQLNITCRGVPINNTNEYTYLGYTLDNSLTLKGCFDKAYKKCCNRLKLLSKLRHHVSSDAANRIYQSMILPVVTYSGLLKLQFTKTQSDRFQSIERRAENIIAPDEHGQMPSIIKILHKQSRSIVRKCLDNRMCTNFDNYFEIKTGGINTRNNNLFLKLPKVKLEFAKQSFYYLGAKIYNDLPIEIR